MNRMASIVPTAANLRMSAEIDRLRREPVAICPKCHMPVRKGESCGCRETQR
jgi:hypothetical protein